MLDNDVDLPVSGPAENTLDQLPDRSFVGSGPETQQDRQRKKTGEDPKKGKAFDPILSVQLVDALILQW